MPIARATLRLITGSNLVGCRAGVSAGEEPFNIFALSLGQSAVQLAQAGAMARQATGGGHLRPLADRGQLVSQGQRSELVAKNR